MLPLYIDSIAFYLQKLGGVTIVWKEFLERIINSRFEMILLLYKKVPDNLICNNIWSMASKNYLPLYSLLFQRYCPVCLKKEKRRFIFHSTYYRYCLNPCAINITTVHDFTYEYYVSGLRKVIHCWQKYKAIRNSDFIICISENTKRDLLKFIPDVDLHKIRVIYNGVSDDYFPIENWNENLIPFKRWDYLLFVGSRNSYKNFNYLVTSLKDTDYKLVIVGSELSSNEVKLLKHNLKSNYYYAGRLSNRDLNNIYNGAFAFVYPSSYEGFGIPVIESQKAGCPVIAYNASSIPEIIGDSTLLLNDLTKEELLGKLSLLKDKNLRSRIIQNGYTNANRFSWDKSYEELVKVYEEAESNIDYE